MNNPKPLVVICSNTSFDANPLGAKPLAHALSGLCDVLYVDPPLSFVTAIRKPHLRASFFGKKFVRISLSLARLIPVVLPGKDRPYIHNATSMLLRRKIKKSIKKLNRSLDKNVIVIATAPHYKVFLPNTFNIYWVMDDYASQPELTGISGDVLTEGHAYLCENSDVNVVVSDYLATTLEHQGYKSTVIYNGADSDRFIFPSPIALPYNLESQLPDNFSLYVGGINNRLDLGFLLAIDPTINIVIAGQPDARMDNTDFTKLCNQKNVTYLGPIDNKYVPALMNKAKVGLVPYADSIFNRSSMPLKIPEYLLCGLPVVSSNLDFVAAFSNDDVTRAETYEEFAHAVRELVSNSPTNGQRAMRSSRISQEWSWNKKTREFLKFKN